MNYATIIAGFGGQGVLMAGNLLAYAAIRQGLNVTFFPSYGVEMRGGTANCTVTLANRDVGSPVTARPQGVIAMNEPSVVKFGPRIVPGGFLLINSSMAPENDFFREGVTVLRLPCNDVALQLGDVRLTSMVALGAYVARTGHVGLEHLEAALPEVLPAKAAKLIPKNIEALREGARLAG